VNDAGDLLGKGVVNGTLGGLACRCVKMMFQDAFTSLDFEQTANELFKPRRLFVERQFLVFCRHDEISLLLAHLLRPPAQKFSNRSPSRA
jgi:hypothetical protein